MDKNKLLIATLKEHQEFLINVATGKTQNFYREYEKRRDDILQLDQDILPAIPKWIWTKRLGSSLWDFFKTVSPHYQARRDFINKSFEDLYEYIEKGNNNPISLSISEIKQSISSDYIDLLWKKIYSRKTFDKDGAITACKTLVETTLKYLLDIKDVTYGHRLDMLDLYKMVSKIYKLEPNKQNSSEFTKLCQGCITIIQSISEIRNQFGDAHGKSTTQARTEPIEQGYVDIIVNMSGSIVTFLLSLVK